MTGSLFSNLYTSHLLVVNFYPGCDVALVCLPFPSQVPQPTCYWHSWQLGNLTSLSPDFDFGLNFTGSWSPSPWSPWSASGSAWTSCGCTGVAPRQLLRRQTYTEHYSTDYNILDHREEYPTAGRRCLPAAGWTWCTTWICICIPSISQGVHVCVYIQGL